MSADAGAAPLVAEPATLADLIALHAAHDPARAALIYEGRTFAYGELDAHVERAANAFAHAGVRPGDRVALMFGNDPAYVAAFYGIARVGGVVVPINPMYRHSEIEHILRDSEPVAALVDAALFADVGDAFVAAGLATLAVAGAHAVQAPAASWEAMLAAAPPRAPVAVAPDDLAALVYTSGTTGKAKGAMHSHATLLANCRQAGRLERRFIGADDRVLVAIPISHMYGMQSGMNGIFRVGGSMVLMPRFHPTDVPANVERYRCTMLLGAPPMFTRWVGMADVASYDWSSLRVVTCGAAPLKASVIDAFRDLTGVRVSESYGLTEAGPTSHSNSAGPVDKVGSVGPPVPQVDCRLVDADGRDVARGEPGEIVLRSPGMMLGYWRNPEATAATIRNGWLYTGDVAVVDEDGYYTIVDRLKDMISVGGFKVWPLEIENALLEHPGIAEAAIVGVRDADAAERPLAFVVRAPGSGVTAEDLAAFARGSLARYKVPVRFEFVDALPRLVTGKILRRDLRARAQALVDGGALSGL